MLLSFRAVFAFALWAIAALPVLLYAVHLSSPTAALETARWLETAGSQALLWGSGAAVLALLLYPPMLPALRLGLRTLRMRLGTDTAPLMEARARLRHLETAADHLTAGRILLQSGRVAESLPHLARAVELDDSYAAARYQLGLALVKAGNLPGAVTQFEEALKIDPEHAFGEALLELGITLERGGADEAAVRVLLRHQERYGPRRRALYYRARAHARSGEREQALEALREAAAPPKDDQRLTLEDDLVRAQARVALLRGGRL